MSIYKKVQAVIIPSGLFGPLLGRYGTHYIRRNKRGDLLIVPRARRDAKTDDQVEQRRRLSLIAQCAHGSYDRFLKPLCTLRHREINAIDVVTRLSIPRYKEVAGIPKVVLPPGIFSSTFFTVTQTRPDGSWARVWMSDWIHPFYWTTDKANMIVVAGNVRTVYCSPPGWFHETNYWEDPLPYVPLGTQLTLTKFITREYIGREVIISPVTYQHTIYGSPTSTTW